MVDAKPDMAADRRQRQIGGHGHLHFIADALALHEQPRRFLLGDDPLQRTDHPGLPIAARRPALRRACAWHSAMASASETSAVAGAPIESSAHTMCATCALSAPPWPTTATSTPRGAYPNRDAPPPPAGVRAAPRAWPSFTARSALRSMTALSTA